ncbi:MAG: hypothetical protein MET45_10805 [Nostoc sp. LLA-1]|nr:hypothetical protein [Cyanocohniella sp. LLY]
MLSLYEQMPALMLRDRLLITVLGERAKGRYPPTRGELTKALRASKKQRLRYRL